MRMRAGSSKFINKRGSHDGDIAKQIRLEHALIMFTCRNSGCFDDMWSIKLTFLHDCIVSWSLRMCLNIDALLGNDRRPSVTLCHPVPPYVTLTNYSIYITAVKD